jgi:hypothetical protein
MGKVLRGETTMAFDKCQVGDGLWSVTRNPNDGEVNYTIDVPEQLISPIEDGLFEIDALTDNSKGVTQARTNIPPSFGPATITEVAWLLEDGTVYAVTRYAALPVMPPESGNTSEVSLRAFLQVGDISAVTLIVDSGISASREFVEEEVARVEAKTTAETDKLSQKLGDLPVSFLVTLPVLTGDVEQSYGNNINLGVSGGVSAWDKSSLNVVIDHYEFELPDKTRVNGPNLIWPIPNDPALVDTEYLFKVRAIDTQNNFSDWIERTVTVVGNHRPNIDSFAHDLPLIGVKNQVVTVQFSGATDTDGDDSLITYRISSPINLVSSKNTGILAGELVSLTFDNIAQDSSAGITVVAVDQAGVQSAPIVITVDLRFLAIVVTPTGLSPSARAIDIDRQPYLSSTPFVTHPAAFDTHLSTRLQVATNAAFNVGDIVIDMSVGALTSVRVDQQLLSDQLYFWRVQHEGTTLGLSGWSDTMQFTTTAIVAGAVLSDGGIVGPQVDGFWLIVSPASSRGEEVYHGLYGTDTTLANISDKTNPDLQSGLENTNELINGYSSKYDGHTTGPDAAEFCRAMGSEWFLPNKEELVAVILQGAQIDAADTSTGFSFSAMGSKYIWSSTEDSAGSSWNARANDGFLYSHSRYVKRHVVPVRRIPI